ncbi:unnamed protein product [Prunus brigantina]
MAATIRLSFGVGIRCEKDYPTNFNLTICKETPCKIKRKRQETKKHCTTKLRK